MSQQQLVNYVFQDVATSSSLGTGTAVTTINGGNAYTTSNLAGALIDSTPIMAANAAMTAAQSMAAQFEIKSTSIGAISPKKYLVPPIHGGLGATFAEQIPIARAWQMNTRLSNSNIPLTLTGTPLVANTAAPRLGANMTFSTLTPTFRENFYDSFATGTSSGTSSAQVSMGNITVNGGSALTQIYGQLNVGTVTVSDDYISFLTV